MTADGPRRAAPPQAGRGAQELVVVLLRHSRHLDDLLDDLVEADDVPVARPALFVDAAERLHHAGRALRRLADDLVVADPAP